jgi:hypothetical protein
LPPVLIGIVPWNAPVDGSKALISLAAKLKLPTSRSPLNCPKLAGARVMPYGEASLLPTISDRTRFPLVSNTETAPVPSGAAVWGSTPGRRIGDVDVGAEGLHVERDERADAGIHERIRA